MTDPIQQPERPICDYEQSTYRTDFWQGQGREYEDAVERVAIKAMLPPAGGRLLDIGAGFGRLADMYAGYGEVILLDYSRSQLEYARQHLGDERFIYVAADIYHLPLATNAVDTTVMVRVLHHLADVPAALAQIARATAPGGTFLLEFANKRHLKNILRYALRRGTNPFTLEPFEFSPLHFDFQPAWVMQQLQQVGWMPETRRAVSLLRAQPLKRIFPPRFLVWIDAILQRPFAALAPAPSVFVRSRNTRRGPTALAARGALFRCPSCGHEPLVIGTEHSTCTACSARWPIENGIFSFK